MTDLEGLGADVAWKVARAARNRRGAAGGIAARHHFHNDLKLAEDEKVNKLWYVPKEEVANENDPLKVIKR